MKTPTTPEGEAILTTHRNEQQRNHLAAKACATLASTVFDRGYGDKSEAMSQLAEAFHALQDVRGVRPWNPDLLWKTAPSVLSSGGIDAAVFVLSVWNDSGPWGKFDLHHALGNWDYGHRGAFEGWICAPWWP